MRFLLKQYRLRARLTQDQVANALDISQGLYNRLENGKRRMNADYIDALARLYKVSPVDLIEDERLTSDIFEEVKALWPNLPTDSQETVLQIVRQLSNIAK